MIRLTTDPIDPRAVEAAVAGPEDGALCTFQGIVRNHHLGRAVDHLEYEAYAEMAAAAMGAIRDEAERRWPGAKVAMVHRTGRLEIGEASVVIAVAHAHRDASFRACRFAIDALKSRVPIWKKEFWSDGSHWVEGVPPQPLHTIEGGQS